MEPVASPTSPTLPFGLDLIKSPTPSPYEESILAIFSDALRPRDSVADDVDDVDDIDDIDGIKSASSAAAIAINTLCPPIDDTDKNYEASKTVEDFLWELWTLVLSIARVVPHDAEHPGQATIVRILDELRYLPRGTVTLWGSEMQLWRDLPLFVQRIDDSSGGPCDDVLKVLQVSQVPEAAVEGWRNQNAFAARCLEAGLAGWDDLAVYALRDALEEAGSKTQRCAILAATEWTIHSSPTLLQKVQDSDDDREEGMALERDHDVPPGHLFSEQEPDARAGLSGVRWAFWKKRFQALLQPDQDVPEDVRAAVAVAVERMTLAETQSAEQTASQLQRLDMELGVE